jgi:hypothetical protein
MFNILNHLDKLRDYGEVKEYGTWMLATCPVCGGKLKINTNPSKEGAYACYTNFCHESFGNPVRKLLYKRKPFSVANNFNPKSSGYKKLPDLVYPIPIKAEAKDFLTKVTFIPPTQKRELTNGHKKLFTYFEYKDFRVVRLDYQSDNVIKKFIYPEYFDSGVWIEGVPLTLTEIPLYRLSYLQPSIVFTEGEKCATIAQKLGLAAVTFPMFAYSERYIDRYVRKLKERGVDNVLYLEDNDKIGQKKADTVLNYCYKNGIGGKSANLVSIFPDYSNVSGFDIYDAHKASLITTGNVIDIVEKCLCQ